MINKAVKRTLDQSIDNVEWTHGKVSWWYWEEHGENLFPKCLSARGQSNDNTIIMGCDVSVHLHFLNFNRAIRTYTSTAPKHSYVSLSLV